MKRLRILSIFMVLFAVMGVVSCDTEPVDPLLLGDDSGEIPTEEPGVFTVRIGDTPFVADSTAATIVDGITTITGYKGTQGERVVITVPATVTGTYTTTAIIYYPGAAGSFYSNISGTALPSGSVTISNIDTVNRRITGIFSFTGYFSDTTQNLPSIAFTQGVFTNIKYNNVVVNPPAGPAAFKVDIDGTTFTADSTVASIGLGRFVVGGLRGANGESVGIVLEQAATVGTFTDAIMTYNVDDDAENTYINGEGADAGTLTISEIDTVNHTVSGTFSFTGIYTDTAAGVPNKVFTNGVFTNIPYETDTPVSDPDVLTATVDTTAVDYTPVAVGLINDTSILISGNGADHKLRLTIASNITPNNYVFSNSVNSDYKATYVDAANVEYNISGGTLTITSNDGTRLKGTFIFDVKNDAGVVLHRVTNGVIDVEYDF